MSIWRSVDPEGDVLAAWRETPAAWIDDMYIDVAVGWPGDRCRILIGPESYPPIAGQRETELYLDRVNLTKLRDQINTALGGQ